MGVIVAGIGLVLSRREGSSEEATANFLRIGLGTVVISTAVTLVSALIS